MNHRRGSVLIALLWCLAILAVVVTTILYTARRDLMIAKNHSDSLQAYYLAVAGAEKAKALLFHDAAERKRTAQHHTAAVYDSPRDFENVELGRGAFRIIRHGDRDTGGQIVFGVNDEESRLNINTATVEEIRKLPGMNAELAAAIADWRDADDNAGQGGAEAEYYSTLHRPYLPRNGNFQTARELLMVRDMPPDYLLGEDANQNGLLDPNENDGAASEPDDNADDILDHGWAGYLTFESVTSNNNAIGDEKIEVQMASETELKTIPGITDEIAKAIIAHRNQNRLENIADLLNVSAPVPANQPSPQPAPNQPPGGSPAPAPGRPGRGGSQRAAPPNQPQPQAQPQQGTGPKVINEDLFLQIADHVKTSTESARRGAVNINTAPSTVLLCLPGIHEELANAIITHRRGNGFFPNVGYLLKVDGMTRDIFSQIAPRVTVRSDNFRIISEGLVKSTGARTRIETIVRLTSTGVDTISWRENL